jgi:hypothetical protein
MVDGGGPPEQCLRYGMPSLSEAPNGGARAFGYFALFKVTRRKGGTLSRHYRSNGYVLNPIQRFLKSKAEYSPARSQPNGGGAFESMMPKNR